MTELIEGGYVPVWLNFPEYVPAEPGKYVVRLGCGERNWTSVKSWEKTHIHKLVQSLHGQEVEEVEHIILPRTWILGQEFMDTKVIAFIREKI